MKITVRTTFILLMVGILFFMLNLLTPLARDDFSYAFFWGTEERITSIPEVIESLKVHYRMQNGRIIPPVLTQSFLIFDKLVFNFVNTVFFLAYGFLICSHIVDDGVKKHPMILALVFILLFLESPGFGSAYLWISGACNHLVASFLLLLYLLPFKKYAVSDSDRSSFLKWIGMFFLGFAAALSTENADSAAILATIAFIVYFACSKRKLMLWHFTGLIGALLGMFVILTAPGRTGEVGNSVGNMVLVFGYLSCCIVKNFKLLIILLFLSLARLIEKKKKLFFEDVKLPLVYLVAFIASVYCGILSSYFPERAYCCSTALAVIMVLRIAVLSYDKERVQFVFTLLLAVIAFGTYADALFRLNDLKKANDYRISIMEEARESGVKSVGIQSLSSGNRYSIFETNEMIGDIYTDPCEWPNEDMAHYYGLDAVYEDNSKRKLKTIL